MENNVNQKNIGKSINIYKKKEEISKAMPRIGILIIGILVGIIICYGIYDLGLAIETWLGIEKENDYYSGYNHFLTAAIIIGIIVLIFISLSCAKLLGIIAKNQVELMEQFGCSNSNPQPVETAHIETKEDVNIAKLKELRDAGIISQVEYEAQISKLQ